MIEQYKQEFATLLQKLSDWKQEDIMPLIERPPENIEGDLAFPCFQLAKQCKKAPQIIAQERAPRLQSESFESFQAVGAYINGHIKTEKLADEVLKKIQKEKNDYGKGETKNKTILIEGRSPNTHKTVHVGHLRNAVVSEAICTIAERAGYNVIRTAYGGDIGAHVAKRIRYYKKFSQIELPQDPEEFSILCGKIYAEATKKISENPESYKEEIHETQKLLESGEKETNTIWKETRDRSIKGLQNIFKELGCTIKRYYRESEVEQPGIKLVKKYVNDPKLPDIKHSQGAIIADLEKYNLGIFVLLKRNGTSLYSTKDIALVFLKEEEYNFDTSLYVVATEQNHHFKQLFKTLELIGYDTNKLIHMGYELVELPTGKMSSRSGTIIEYHKRRDEAVEKAYNLIKDRDVDDKQQTAKNVTFAALKFSMLLQDTYKKIRLDMNDSLSFEGETGPYLQYTYARCCAIMKKAKDKINEGEMPKTKTLNSIEEKRLIVHMAELPQIVENSMSQLKPSIIARYTLELCRYFNAFYSKNTVIGVDKELEKARTLLVYSTQHTLGNCLKILGIQTLEKM